MLTLHEGKKALARIIENFPAEHGMNEAETRFHIIDDLLCLCLGWEKGDISVENYENRQFTDYELGHPRQVIWEAKREGITFEFPSQLFSKLIVDIPSIMDVSKDAKIAIEQAQSYCSNRGVAIANVTNGHQHIVFLASRSDGISPLKANALVFKSLTDMYDNFSIAWNMLSCAGIRELNVMRYLTSGETGIPLKISSRLQIYPRVRYSSQLQKSLRQLAELLIQDTLENDKLEETFYKNCYCESGALSKYAMLSRDILQARYAALFSDSELSPSVVPVKPNKDIESIDPAVVAESISKRPIVLIGDVGVGKTSFLKNLQYSSAYSEFRDAFYIYIDLGSKSSLSSNLKNFILSELEEQLLKKYGVDVLEESFVKGTYASDIIRFKNSIWGRLEKTDTEKYTKKYYELIEEKLSQRDIHLKNSIAHLSKMRDRQVIICLDNADQRDFETQQAAFIISQEFARDWDALSFIALRPQTFYKSKQVGALTAYPHKVFTISPPRIDLVIEKRLKFALAMAEGQQFLRDVEFIRLNSVNISCMMKCLIYSLDKNSELLEFLENITGGNIRLAIEFIVNFIGSPNIDAQKIINNTIQETGYIIPLHEFTKQAILGDYAHYEPVSSLAMNIFDISYPDNKEHFLTLFILAFTDDGCQTKDRDGFCKFTDITAEMQNFGFTVQQVETCLRRATNKKLIETSKRITFEENEEQCTNLEMPRLFRVTSIGLYHLRRWCCEFSYIDTMIFDTPIFSNEIQNAILPKIESFTIEDRYFRATQFKNYLVKNWNSLQSKPKYFDFMNYMQDANQSFLKVERFIDKKKFRSLR